MGKSIKLTAKVNRAAIQLKQFIKEDSSGKKKFNIWKVLRKLRYFLTLILDIVDDLDV